MRVCVKCQCEKHDDEFYWNYSTGGNKGPNAKRHRYRRADCKACFRLQRRGKKCAYIKAGSPERPPAGTACEVCQLVPGERNRLMIDHKHTLRPEDSVMLGWVCRRCNSTVLAGDEQLLERALAYKQRRGEDLRRAAELE